MRPQPKLRPTAAHVVHIRHHDRSRSSSGPSLQNKKQTKAVSELLLDDTIFDCSAITDRHWRRRHLNAVGLIASSRSIEAEAVLESDALVIAV